MCTRWRRQLGAQALAPQRDLQAGDGPAQLEGVVRGDPHVVRAGVDPDVRQAVQGHPHSPSDPVGQRFWVHRRYAAVDRFGGAGLDAQAGAHGFGVSVAEPVLPSGPHETRSTFAVLLDNPLTGPADQCRRNPVGLALHQVGCGGQLVGQRPRGDGQGPAVGVGPATQVVQDLHPRSPEREVDLPRPPRTAGRVAEHHAEPPAPGPGDQGGTKGAGRGVGVGRQQQEAVGAAGVGGVDTRRCHDGAGDGVHDPGHPVTRTPLGHDPSGLTVDDGLPVGAGVGPQAQRLRDDLAGDDEHVTVGQALTAPLHGGQEQRGEVRARRHLRHTGQRNDDERCR